MDKPTEQPPAPTFSPFAHAIRRPVAVTMVALAVAVFGLVAYSRLPVALMPRFSHPTLTIRTEYPGSAPEEVEQFVTAPLEKALSIVSGLIEVRSLSLAGLSEVVLNFQWGTDLGLALLEVREKLDRLRLPDEVGKPLLLRFNPEESPILRLALLGDFPLTRLRDVAENDLKPLLQTLPGVAFVQIGGGAPPEVAVELDEGRLSRLGLSAGGVAARLAEESINLAGGVLLEGNTEYRVRTLNELASLEEMREVLVSPRGKPPVRLGDIARVRLGEGKVSVLARANGLEAVEIEVFKEADANVVATAERVRRLIWGAGPGSKTPKRKPSAEKGRSRRRGGGHGPGGRAGPPRQARPYTDRLEKGMTLSLVADRSRFIEAALGGVRKTAGVGGLLAMAVLYLFLGRLRLTLFVAVAIPLSIVAAFLAMFITGLTLNMISLGGLALGVGMLVDNAIVVLEAIHRLRERGLPATEAALEGLREVGGAVTASTLTTVAVFLPLVFVEGIAGQLFNDLALTVVFSLLASLAVALFLLPMLYVTL
ncbi:MAG: efflux RND transporter permease subunit, partial [bacterium]